LVAIGVLGLLLAWNPPPLVGLFAQKGVYGLAAASMVPVLFGVALRGDISAWVTGPAAIIGLATHLLANLVLGVSNPAVSASYGIFAALIWGLIALAAIRYRQRLRAVDISTSVE
jgi:SSS family solute:Na+ symporter/sodium/pantothenate symporter